MLVNSGAVFWENNCYCYYIWDACTPVGFIDKRQRRPIFVQNDMLRMLNLMNKVRDEENYCRKGVSDTICVMCECRVPVHALIGCKIFTIFYINLLLFQ